MWSKNWYRLARSTAEACRTIQSRRGCQICNPPTAGQTPQPEAEPNLIERTSQDHYATKSNVATHSLFDAMNMAVYIVHATVTYIHITHWVVVPETADISWVKV